MYIIGDVHGCCDELKDMYRLIYQDHIENNSQDKCETIVFLGDYIDRGPNSRAVINYISRIRNQGIFKIVALKGNHEQMFCDEFPRVRYCETYDSFGGDVCIMEGYAEDLRRLPHYFKLGNVFCSHANIQLERDEDHMTDDFLLWDRGFYDTRTKNGFYHVHGHTPLNEEYVTDNCAYIDTGVVFGGYLICLKIDENDTSNRKIFTVRAKMDYNSQRKF